MLIERRTYIHIQRKKMKRKILNINEIKTKKIKKIQVDRQFHKTGKYKYRLVVNRYSTYIGM